MLKLKLNLALFSAKFSNDSLWSKKKNSKNNANFFKKVETNTLEKLVDAIKGAKEEDNHRDLL